MAVIIGGGSSVTAPLLLADGTGVLSISYNYSVSIEKQWQLGSFSPYFTNVLRERSITLVVYGIKPAGTGGSIRQSLSPSTDCTDKGAISITFNPSACSSAVVGFTSTFFPTGYSYTKEHLGYGQETWQLKSKPEVPASYSGEIRMIRGVSSAQALVGADVVTYNEMGVEIDITASQDENSNWIDSESGSVAASSPTGSVDFTRELVVTGVGASTGKNVATSGKRGQVSCTIPYTTVYL